MFERTTEVAQLRAADAVPLGSAGVPHGAVTMELLFDPPGHVRLPITDDEIVGRALAAQPLAAREIILWTYDTSQSCALGRQDFA